MVDDGDGVNAVAVENSVIDAAAVVIVADDFDVGASLATIGDSASTTRTSRSTVRSTSPSADLIQSIT